jgi:hypothetical protein
MGSVEDDPVKQGQLLRNALAEHVRLAKKMRQFQRSGAHFFIDVGEIVKRYLPEGCTFDYAETVLSSAGFKLDPRPSPEAPGRYAGSEWESDVNAFLGYGYTREKFEGVDCVVTLRPAKSYEYSRVHRVLTTCGFVFAI